MSYFYQNMSNKQRNPESIDGYSEIYRNSKYDDVGLAELIFRKDSGKWELLTDYTYEHLWFSAKSKALTWLKRNDFISA